MNETIVMIIWLGVTPSEAYEPESPYKENLLEEKKVVEAENENENVYIRNWQDN